MNNPAAFPQPIQFNTLSADDGGMTLLDYFAAVALQGCVQRLYSDKLLADLGSTDAVAQCIAKGSYLIAEAMLEERQRRLQ